MMPTESIEPRHASILTVHGYFAEEGRNTVDRCHHYFRQAGLVVHEFDYTWLNGPLSGLVGARMFNGQRATRLVYEQRNRTQKPWRVALGHSNGCAILYRVLLSYPEMFHRYLFVNPALDSDVYFPHPDERPEGSPRPQVLIYYTPGDLAVTAAQWAPQWMNGLWGDMGAVGYQGEEHPDVLNIDTSMEVYGQHRSTGHSDKFSGANVKPWSEWFTRDALAVWQS